MEHAINAAAGAAVNEAVVAGASTPAEITTDVEAATSAAKLDLDADLRAVWDKNNPSRWSDGKFAPREHSAQHVGPNGAETAGRLAAEAPAGDAATDQSVYASLEQAASAVVAPISWSAEMKAKWSTL